MTSEDWTDADLPDLTGVRAVVTGANTGLGFHTALELARHGAHVVLACRDPFRGDEALGQIRVQAPGASVELRQLDLADLASVRAFASGLLAQEGWDGRREGHGDAARLDVLVNNAGVMGVPPGRTADGFERHLGINHLGHFALTGLLLPALLRGSVHGGPARVVTMSSGLHRIGVIDPVALRAELPTKGQPYRRWRSYGTSKLANLLFTAELQRRADAAGLPLAALAAHPGWAATGLMRGEARPAVPGLAGRVEQWVIALGDRYAAQPAAHGAWPCLRAAADPMARGGQFYGPSRLGEQRGSPTVVQPSPSAGDADAARRLWDRSAELTGVHYRELDTQPAR